MSSTWRGIRSLTYACDNSHLLARVHVCPLVSDIIAKGFGCLATIIALQVIADAVDLVITL